MIQKADAQQIIESLEFPDRDARSVAAQDFESFFQKTVDFERFLEDARWVVRGRKGTGKSTLFHLFTEHRDNAARRARGRLEGIDIVPGHGPVAGAKFRPTTDVFGDIATHLDKSKKDWLSLWRAYALVRIHESEYKTCLDAALRHTDMKPLREHLKKFPHGPGEDWRTSHTRALLAFLETPLNGLCRDLMRDLNQALEQQNKKLWLLYDDLSRSAKVF